MNQFLYVYRSYLGVKFRWAILIPSVRELVRYKWWRYLPFRCTLNKVLLIKSQCPFIFTFIIPLQTSTLSRGSLRDELPCFHLLSLFRPLNIFSWLPVVSPLDDLSFTFRRSLQVMVKRLLEHSTCNLSDSTSEV